MLRTGGTGCARTASAFDGRPFVASGGADGRWASPRRSPETFTTRRTCGSVWSPRSSCSTSSGAEVPGSATFSGRSIGPSPNFEGPRTGVGGEVGRELHGGGTAHLDCRGARGEAICRALRDQLGFDVTGIEPCGTGNSGGSTPLRITLADGHVFGKLYATNYLRADRWYKLGRTIRYGAPDATDDVIRSGVGLVLRVVGRRARPP